jgi:hypothetical protein
VGQSLGAIQGTLDVATNPRFKRVVLNEAGATLLDIFTNSPAFTPQVNALLASLNIGRGTAAFLQFLVVAKTVVDPADPINYVNHIQASTLPNLLPPLGGATDGSIAMQAKAIIGQTGFCDQVIPNPFGFLWSSNAPIGPLPVSQTFGQPGNFQLFFKGTAAPTPTDLAACPPPGGSPLPASTVTHAYFSDWVNAAITSTAQADAAAFLATGSNQPSLVVLP